jgi:hypothetical protein
MNPDPDAKTWPLQFVFILATIGAIFGLIKPSIFEAGPAGLNVSWILSVVAIVTALMLYLPFLRDLSKVRSGLGEPLEGSARDLLAAAEDDGKAQDGGAANSVEAFLRSVLATGERKQSDIAAKGAPLGFSKDKLFRASKELGVVKRKGGLAEGWRWSLRAEF